LPPTASRDLAKAEARATLEGGVHQQVGPQVALGRAGFADDTAPPDALVATPDGKGGWALGETLAEAKAAAGTVQGRRSGGSVAYPLEVPPGEWPLTLRTTWVEPAYVETDASWCVPGGEPAVPVANGGAFGGKHDSPVMAAARRLADEHRRAVRVVLSREDTVRIGPKRPPVAAGIRHDGTGVLRVVRTHGVAEVIMACAPGLDIEEVDVAGPPTSIAIRGAGWVEAAVLQAAVGGWNDGADHTTATGPTAVTAPNGARATATIDEDGAIDITVACGDPLDPVVLRSYCIGAAHMALGWVTSEGISVDEAGVPVDLTIRSFGILRAKDMPAVRVTIVDGDGPPVNGSDAVFAAVAAAAWRRTGFIQDWPTNRGGSR
jgi:xanthine dehydrogenase small subunit